ncbi:hypothetical protein UA08_02544 [Talaromyces atroroseus]|uniref:Zn(2)-C6 fungal-type domain-containing protein n=1 Tax=Talaromyces atroroseus TaxID=1441469 RepID=A0A225AUF3_TALAT|nr:hypothetical protein UA08_02544 [Talaromyces atroroseus]OKL61994.1 hypothetical protein UA08_02544 [Talaromyces atroroseus]
MEQSRDNASTIAPGTSRPAPYGRACSNCARAKCKCILRANGDSCERCFRLKKVCSPSSSIRKKRVTPRNSSQAARLERKLDGLVSLLRASSSQGNLTEESFNDVSDIVNAVNANNTAASTTSSTAAPSPSCSSNIMNNNKGSLRPPMPCLDFDNTPHQDHRNAATKSTASSSTPGSGAPSPFPYILPRDVEPTAEEERLWYQIFIDKFVDHAPFLRLIVQNMSCTQLRQEKPFLWLSIMSVACPFVQKQWDLGRAVREVLAREVLVEGERNVDYLLGSLCFAQCIAFFHHKAELLPWSPYLDDCLKLLDDAKETFSDELLICQVRLQQILSNTTMLYARLRGSESEQSTRLVVPYIRSLKRQVESLRSQIPEHVAANKFIQIGILYVEVAVNEVAMVRTQHAALMMEKELETMECLLECLQSIQAWTELFRSLDYSEYIGMPFGLWKQLSLMIFTLVRLATLEDPAWDTYQVRRAVDLPGLLNHVSTSMSQVANLAPWKQNADNVHSRSSKLVATLTTWSKSVYDGTIPSAPIIIPNPPFAPPAKETGTAMDANHNLNNNNNSNNSNNSNNPLLMINDGAQQVQSETAAAAAFAQQQQDQQGQNLLVPELFPYFNQEPWTNDGFGFWGLWNGGRATMG